MVNLVHINPTLGEDDPRIEAAKQQVAYAMAQMAHGGSPAGVPIAEGRGAVQAKYGWGNALTDLANKLAQGYALGKAQHDYAGLQNQQNSELDASNQKAIAELAPGIVKGGQAPTQATLDAVPAPAPSFDPSADLASAMAGRPAMAAPAPDQPVTLNDQTATPDHANPQAAMLQAAVSGLPRHDAASFLAQQLAARALPPKETAFDLAPGAVRYAPTGTPGKFTEIANNPKEVTPARAERKTRLLDNHMAQDYDFYGDGRPDQNVGTPYKHSEPPASVINMGSDDTKSSIESDARKVAAGLMPVPPLTGRGAQAQYNAQVRKRAFDLHPNLDAADFPKRAAAEKAFASSIDGRNLDSYNTIAQHVAFGEQAYKALQNGDVPALNSIGNTLGIQTQGKAPADVYRNIATFLGNETARATIGGQSGEGDRQALSKMFSDAASPEMAAANYSAAKSLIGGRVASSRRRYQSSTRVYDVDKKNWSEDSETFDSKLTPAALDFEKVGASTGHDSAPGIAGTHITQDAVAAELARRKKARGG